MDYTNLVVVLTWLMALGAPYLVGKLVAYLVENWKAWATFPTQVKFVAPMVVSVAIALGARFLLAQTEFLAVVGPYFTMVVEAVLAYLGTQVGYMETKKASYGKRYSGKP